MEAVAPATTTKKLPHLLKYMGSKREIINFIADSIKSINTDSEWVCDLFSGTGVVSAAIKDSFNVHANDVQKYSHVLSNTYLINVDKKIHIDKIVEVQEKVFKLVKEIKSNYPKLTFEYHQEMTLDEFKYIELQQQDLINQNFSTGFHLFSKYYSGTYWSFEQCVWIDSIRAIAEQQNNTKEYPLILSALIFAMSYVSQSTGHYAQYRDATSESSMLSILGYRQRQIWPYFEKKLAELISYANREQQIVKSQKITTLDYIDCLTIIEENSIVYADPPYQSVHYSRFYHAIETLVKYDYPKVFYKGRYREDRHQSIFCMRKTVKPAFEILFSRIQRKKSHLILSYCDTGMISLNEIESIYKDLLSKNYTYNLLEKDHMHMKMGRSDTSSQDVTEYLLLFEKK